ncbi:hypothetical protein WR25_24796 [Diploscapter pachys]|uniref:NR LBD domain-containing protein n=1 Tax=Diploscapter pachys TaxID=2018661 RepID=A0A2A2KRS6_9BILA|nr:hypothetical protein WR25_24796 [Diploscapter pachys]
MDPLAIQMNIDPRKNKMIMNIVGKRKIEEETALVPSTSKISNNNVPSHLRSIEDIAENLIDNLIYVEWKTDVFRKSAYNPPAASLPGLAQLLSATSNLSIADKLGPMPNWPIERNISMEKEKQMLKQGLRPSYYNRKEKKHWLAFDLLTIIEYAKTFPVIHQLSEQDRIVLLKSVSLLCYNLQQSWFSYESKSDTVIHPDGTPPLTMRYFGVEYSKKSILPFMRDHVDKKEYCLLKAIILCNPATAGLSDEGVQLLTTERERYSRALFLYCMANRGLLGPAHYAAVLSLVDMIEHQAKRQKDMHLLLRIELPNRCRVQLIEEVMD